MRGRAYRIILGSIVGPLYLAASASGGTYTWANNGTDYNTGSNWIGNTAPPSGSTTSAGDLAIFPATVTSQPNLSAAKALSSLDLQAGGWVFSGSTITFGNGLGTATPGGASANYVAINSTNNATGFVTFNNPVALAANGTFACSLGVTVAGGFETTGTATTATRTFTANATTEFTPGINNTASFGVAGSASVPRTLTIDGASAVSISSIMYNGTGNSAGAVKYDGTGTLTMSGANNTYTGGFTQNKGTVAIDRDRSFGAVGVGVKVTGNGTLQAAASAVSVASDRSIQITAAKTLTLDTQGNAFQIDGVISETAAAAQIVKEGLGLLTLTNTNSITGTFTVNGGGVAVGGTGVFGSGLLKFTNVTSNGSISAIGSARTVANAIQHNANWAVAGSNDITLSGTVSYPSTGSSDRAITISNSGITTFSNTINISASGIATTRKLTFNGAGPGDLLVSGQIVDGSAVANSVAFSKSGVTTLTNANTYTGGTTVTAGTLRVNNTSGSGTGTGSVNVNSSATLSGTGNIAGAVNVSGTLAPGGSIGTLTSGTSLSLAGGSTYAVELNFSDAGPSTADKFVVSNTSSGTVSLGNGVTFPTLKFVATYTGLPGNSHVFTLIQNDNTTTAGTTTGQFDGIAQNTTVIDGYLQYSVDYAGGDGNDVVVTFTSVPEPGSAGIALAIAGGLIRRRRR